MVLKVQNPFKLLYFFFFPSHGREKEPFVRKTVSGKVHVAFANVTSSKLNLWQICKQQLFIEMWAEPGARAFQHSVPASAASRKCMENYQTFSHFPCSSHVWNLHPKAEVSFKIRIKYSSPGQVAQWGDECSPVPDLGHRVGFGWGRWSPLPK